MVLYPVAFVVWVVVLMAVWRTDKEWHLYQIFRDATITLFSMSISSVALAATLTFFVGNHSNMGVWILTQFGMMTGMVSCLLIAAGGLRAPGKVG